MINLRYMIFLSFFIHFILSKPLSVLFVTNKFPYEPRQYIDNQITGFIDAGVDVTILADRDSDYTSYPLAEKYKFKDITFYKELPENKRSFDIIYCQFPDMAKEMLLKRKAQLIFGKIVVCFRGASEFNHIKKGMMPFFKDVDFILVVCKAFRDRLISFGCPLSKIKVHHSAIDVNNFEFQPRNLLPNELIKIISIGRLHKMKGYDVTIDAIRKVKDVYPNIKYNIYGIGNEESAIKNIIEQYDLQETVFLKGYIDHDLVSSVLHKHHIFILGSCTTKTGSGEGIPNVLMEALATGMPAVGTAHGGIPELLEDGVIGFIVDEKNSNELAEKIVLLIGKKNLWVSFGQKGREKVLKEHNKDIQNKKLIKLFKIIRKN